ncbi:MAG: hypothetical protein ACI9EF_002920 [Pseudohongiellaceae bacterium]|jgi:hypothetical protein
MTCVPDFSATAVAMKPGKAPESPALLRALVHRVTNGFSVEEYNRARSYGHEGYVESHLDHLSIDDSLIDGLLAPLEVLGMTAAQLNAANYPEPAYVVNQHKHGQIVRSITSKRQLYERTVAFFTDHFSIYQKDGGVRFLKVVDDREVIRANALGNFSDMLRASAHSAAMCLYLDNNTNSVLGPQENYGRELMELHTLGVDGGYDENDVKEAARCLTGWSFERCTGCRPTASLPTSPKITTTARRQYSARRSLQGKVRQTETSCSRCSWDTFDGALPRSQAAEVVRSL